MIRNLNAFGQAVRGLISGITPITWAGRQTAARIRSGKAPATFALLIFALSFCAAVAATTGTWTPSGSGGSATATGVSVTVAGVTFVAPAPAPSAGTLNATNFWTNPYGAAVNGGPSLVIQPSPWGTTQTVTITFGRTVNNPVIHFDRLGGGVGTAASTTVWTLSSSVSTGGSVTLTELAGGTPNFDVTGSSITRSGAAQVSGASECVTGAANRPACGSVQFNGTGITSLTFTVTWTGANTGNTGDAVELAVSIPDTRVIIRKQSLGGTGTFGFTGTNGVGPASLNTGTTNPISSATFTLTNQNAAFTITESTIPAGFGITSTACVDQLSNTITSSRVGNVLTVAAAAYTPSDQTITCTFTNSTADMAVSLSGMPDGMAGNQFYTGTFTCTNIGGVAATNATCAISGLPAGLTTACSPTPPVASVAVGGVITCTVFGQPVITSAGTITLTGTTSATNDPITSNNTATLLVNVVPTVAFIDAFRAEIGPDGRTVLVSWSTKAERGTAGFRVERLEPDTGSWRRLGAGLLPGLVVAPQGGDYQLVDSGARIGGTYRYRLIEHDVHGVERVYGPWVVTAGAATPVASARLMTQVQAAGPWKVLKPGYAARHRLVLAKPKPAAARSQNGAVPTRAAARSAGASAVRLRTRAAGLYSLDAAALNQSASLLGVSGGALRTRLSSGQARLESGGALQAYHYDSAADRLYFVGAAHETRETSENVYRLTQAAGRVMPVTTGAGPAPGPVGVFREVRKFEEHNTDPNLGYLLLPWVHSDPDADYWYWDYVYAPSKPSATLNVSLTDPAALGQGAIKVHLRGVSNEAPGNDHRASIKLNGVALSGSVEWDGNNAAVLEASFNQNVLGAVGANGAVQLQLEVDGAVLNGADYSYFLIDKVEIAYDRVMRARQGGVWLSQLAPGVNAVDGLTGAGPIHVIENPGGAQARLRQDVTVSAGAVGRMVSFSVNAAADYLVSDAPAAPVQEADYASALKTVAHNTRYLIIAPRAFSAAAQALAAHRAAAFSGRVEIAWLDDIYDEFSFGRASSKAIDDFLAYVVGNWRVAPRYVVLMGRGTLDHRDLLGLGESVIPLRLAPTPWGLAPSDNQYADIDGDHLPDFALGRIAASSDAAAQAYVNKITAYEAQGLGDWSRRAVIVADNPDAGGDFAANSNNLATMIARYGGYTISKLYQTSPPPIPGVRDALLAGWPAGYGYVNYSGHGSYRQFGDSSENYLLDTDVAALGNGTRLPVVAAMTCATGDSSNPGVLGLADALTLQPNGGAIAAFAASGLSNDADAYTLNRFFTAGLLSNRWSVGPAAHHASRVSASGAKPIQPYMHDIFMVSGDPAVRLR